MCKISYINNRPIVEIDNFLSDKEIDELLETRINSFKKAQTHYPTYYRNNDRLIEDNESLSSFLFEKLRNYKSPFIKEFKSVNEKIRLCRYQENQTFSIHQDGVYYPNEYQESKYTFLLYLNGSNDFDDGQTNFYVSKYSSPEKTVKAQKGKLVIFDHKIWHEGATVKNGTKYILRSDIIVDRSINNLTQHDGYIWSLLKFNDNHFFSSGRDTKIKLWNDKLELQNSIKVHSKSVIKVVKLDKDQFVSCSRDFTIKKWNLKGEILESNSLNEMFLSIDRLADDKLVVGGTSGNIFILNQSLQVEQKIQVHSNWIWDVKVLDANTILSCSEDGTVKKTNISSKKVEQLYSQKEPLFCLNVKLPNMILVGSKKGELIEICSSLKQANHFNVHKDIIRSIKRYKDFIITASEDNSVKLFNIKNQSIKTLFESDNFIQDVLVLKDRLYTAGFDGRVVCLDSILS